MTIPERLFDWEGRQSALQPAGLGAWLVEWMWWLSLGMFAAVWLLVIAATLYAVRRRRSPHQAAPDGQVGAVRAVVVATGATVVVLLLFFALSLSVGHRAAGATAAPALTVEVVGKQWWWEIHYLDARGNRILRTANEIHLPVGESAALVLESADVIHSFWAPNLHGKVDMIPGRRNVLALRPLETGVFRAQCAEFCGRQHAKMAMMVVVQSRAGFERWLAEQLEPAAPVTERSLERGLHAFLLRCAECHTVRGTAADGREGPDLTHVASRLTVGGGFLPNTKGHLGGWIANPQALKQGSPMPQVAMSADEFSAILQYLGTLE